MGKLKQTEMAFPVATIDGYTQYGMTLRDYFAATAMQSIINWDGLVNGKNTNLICKNSYEYIAENSYKIADAMLSERNK